MIAKAKVDFWAPGSLLDVYYNKSEDHKLEFRNFGFEKDGSHNDEIHWHHRIGSAGVHTVREKNGRRVSSVEGVLSQIYQEFCKAMEFVSSPQEVKVIMAKYSNAVDQELGLKAPEKKTGIIKML